MREGRTLAVSLSIPEPLAVDSARTRDSGARDDRTDRRDALVSGIRTGSFALGIAIAWVGAVGATPLEQAGTPLGIGSSQHVSYASPDWRVASAPGRDQGAPAIGSSFPPIAGAGTSGALVINATFDSSITGDANAAAIETMINNAVAILESSFNDPITVSIRFRYATALPNGSPLPSGALAETLSVHYAVPWNTYVSALTADASTANDATANASLPGSALSTNILPSSADGRAVGLSTPPAMFADGSIGAGGPYDGIVTLNSSEPFNFTRPPTAGMFDALRTTEHEMDEVLGLGFSMSGDLEPQDLFSWSAPGTRNLTSSGTRYFSIDGGATNIVGFNQNPSGDFGDWLSASCPQANPYVQNAFSCANQESDVTQTSPEGINLDVIGYDLITPTPTSTSTTTTAPITTTTPSTTTTTAGSTSSTTSTSVGSTSSTTSTTVGATTTTITTTTLATPSTSTTTSVSTTTSTTSTTVQPTTTSTTQPTGGCGNEPVGPTFLSLDCRLAALIAEVAGETDLGALEPKLLDQLQKARTHKEKAESLCRQASKRRTRNALHPAVNKIVQFLATLHSHKARTIPQTAKDALRTAADAIRLDLQALQRAVQCPQDVPPA